MRLIVLSALTSWMGRAASIVLNLIVLGIAHRELTPQWFGVLLFVSAAGTGISFMNLGLSRTVMTHAARFLHRNEKFIWLSFQHASVVGAAVYGGTLAMFLSGCALLPWDQVIDVPGGEYVPFITAMALVGGLTTSYLLLSPFEGISIARQQTHILNLFRLAGYLVCLAIFALSAGKAPSLIVFALALHSAPVIGDLMNALWLMRRTPQLVRFKPPIRFRVLALHWGESTFFILMFAAYIARHQLSVLLVGLAVDATEIGLFGVLMRVLMLGVSVASGAIYPLRAEIIRARAGTGVAQAHRLVAQVVIVTTGGALVAGIMTVGLGEPALRLWLGEDLSFPLPVRLLFAALIVTSVVDLLLTIVLDALGRFKFVAVGSAIETILTLAVGFAAAVSFGVVGMLAALLFGQLIFGTIIMGVATLRTLNDHRSSGTRAGR